MEHNPSEVARDFRQEAIDAIKSRSLKIKLLGLLGADMPDAEMYSKFMKVGCDAVGVQYEEKRVPPRELEAAIRAANADASVTAMIVYYPIFGGVRDVSLRATVEPFKDVEGLHPFWLEKLYANVRQVTFDTATMKSLLPCTPLAILKMIEFLGHYHRAPSDSGTPPLQGKTVTIFNRSEVVGRPLAHMLYHDGARVYSFDINGVVVYEPGIGESDTCATRAEALSASDIIITGVPNDSFRLIGIDEVPQASTCINFSSIENFSSDIAQYVAHYVPRVGPVTVSMCLRNIVRIAMARASLA